jgi:hypothetical protein
MANTYTLISSVTVGSGGASEITFSSIPNTYTDLLVKLSGRLSQTGGAYDGFNIKFNNTTSNWSSRTLSGNGSSASSGSETGTYGSRFLGINIDGSTASTFGNLEVYIPNYAGSSYKSVSSDSVTENNDTGAFIRLGAGLWSDTSAITSLTLYNQDYTPSNAFAQYSTAYLYGISNA